MIIIRYSIFFHLYHYIFIILCIILQSDWRSNTATCLFGIHTRYRNLDTEASPCMDLMDPTLGPV